MKVSGIAITVWAVVGVLIVAAQGACSGGRSPAGPPPAFIDLLASAGSAEFQPADPREGAFEVRDVAIAGRTRRAIQVPRPSRVSWTIDIPAHAVFSAEIGLIPLAAPNSQAGARCRVGISDGRVYEALQVTRLPPGPAGDRSWVPIRVDLSGYAGWQWSLFYRPSRTRWRLTLSVDGQPTSPPGIPAVAWAIPAVRSLR